MDRFGGVVGESAASIDDEAAAGDALRLDATAGWAALVLAAAESVVSFVVAVSAMASAVGVFDDVAAAVLAPPVEAGDGVGAVAWLSETDRGLTRGLAAAPLPAALAAGDRAGFALPVFPTLGPLPRLWLDGAPSSEEESA